MKFGIFGTFEKNRAVSVDPLTNKMGWFFFVTGVVLEEQISVAVEDKRFHAVKDIQFTKGLFLKEASTVGVIDAVSVLVPLGPQG